MRTIFMLLLLLWDTVAFASFTTPSQRNQAGDFNQLLCSRPLTSYEYDIARGSRLTNVVNGAYSSAIYYHTNSSLLAQVMSYNGTTPQLSVAREYDKLNRLSQIASVAAGSGQEPIVWGYGYDQANQRREGRNQDGDVWRYGYDKLGQVITGRKFAEGVQPVYGQQFEYDYDDIGNRTAVRWGGNSGGSPAAMRPSSYTRNSVNQYSQRTVPATFDVLGMGQNGATIKVNTVDAGRSGEYFFKEETVSNDAAVYAAVTVTSTQGGNNAPNTSGKVYVPQTPEVYTHDYDGNLTKDGRWDYTWDAENRLTKMESFPTAPTGSKRRLEFKYDYLGRRIWKKETNLDTSAIVERKYLYDGWNLIAELDASNGLVQSYTWGLDLSGSLHGAGGVGGLLAVRPNTGAAHFVAYDGMANVAGLVDGSSGSWSALYEYGPFGEPIRETGPMAEANPFRFSTKFTDGTSGFSYYGYRFYNPTTGRWLNRDPLEEWGGLNLYGFVGNNPNNLFDVEGLQAVSINGSLSNLGNVRGPAHSWSGSFNSRGGLTSSGFRSGRGSGGIDPLGQFYQNAYASQVWMDRLGREIKPGETFLTNPNYWENIGIRGVCSFNARTSSPVRGWYQSPGGKGRAGENAVSRELGLDRNYESWTVNGNVLIPDFVLARIAETRVPSRVAEVKYVGFQSFTRQLRNYGKLVGPNGRVDVYLPPSARVSGPLQAEFNDFNSVYNRVDLIIK